MRRSRVPQKNIWFEPSRPRKPARNRRKRNLRRLFCLFGAALVLCGGMTYALLTPALVVKKVTITGVRLADMSKVEQAAGAAVGANIFLVRKSPILARIRRLSEIADARMGRTFPDRMWVRVTERTADAIITDNTRCCMLQKDGLMFHMTDGTVRGLPLIKIPTGQKIIPGARASSDSVRYALKVIWCARQKHLPVGKISVDPDGDICLNMESGFYVKLGGPDEIACKLSLLRRALAYKPSLAWEAIYIDLSCPSAPVWKPRIAASSAS